MLQNTVHLLCSGNVAGVSHARVDAEELGQAEVGDLGVHVCIQKDVAGLEIAVDDGQPRGGQYSVLSASGPEYQTFSMLSKVLGKCRSGEHPHY
jgi:hypothetical protein